MLLVSGQGMLGGFNHNRSGMKRKSHQRLKNKFPKLAKKENIELEKANDGQMKDIRNKISRNQREEKSKTLLALFIAIIFGPIMVYGIITFVNFVLDNG